MFSRFSAARSPAPSASSALGSSGRSMRESVPDERASIPSREPSSARLRLPSSPSTAHEAASASSAPARPAVRLPASPPPPSAASSTMAPSGAPPLRLLNLRRIVDCDEPSPKVSSRVASVPARVASRSAVSPRSTGCASRSAVGGCSKTLLRSMPCASNCAIASASASASSMSSSAMFSRTASSNVSCEMRADDWCDTLRSFDATPTVDGGWSPIVLPSQNGREGGAGTTPSPSRGEGRRGWVGMGASTSRCKSRMHPTRARIASASSATSASSPRRKRLRARRRRRPRARCDSSDCGRRGSRRRRRSST